MAFRRYVVPVLLFVMVVGVAFGTLQMTDAAADSAAREAVNVTNESVSQQVGLWQFVNKATADHTTGFGENVTVYNASDAELTEGVDYRWNSTDGSIYYENTANVTDGDVGNISYTYYRNSQEVRGLSRVINPIVGFVAQFPLFVGGLGLGILLLAAVAILSRYLNNSSAPKTNR